MRTALEVKTHSPIELECSPPANVGLITSASTNPSFEDLVEGERLHCWGAVVRCVGSVMGEIVPEGETVLSQLIGFSALSVSLALSDPR